MCKKHETIFKKYSKELDEFKTKEKALAIEAILIVKQTLGVSLNDPKGLEKLDKLLIKVKKAEEQRNLLIKQKGDFISKILEGSGENTKMYTCKEYNGIIFQKNGKSFVQNMKTLNFKKMETGLLTRLDKAIQATTKDFRLYAGASDSFYKTDD